MSLNKSPLRPLKACAFIRHVIERIRTWKIFDKVIMLSSTKCEKVGIFKFKLINFLLHLFFCSDFVSWISKQSNSCFLEYILIKFYKKITETNSIDLKNIKASHRYLIFFGRFTIKFSACIN